MFGELLFYGINGMVRSECCMAAVLMNAPCLPMLWKIVEKILSAERCHVYLCK